MGLEKQKNIPIRGILFDKDGTLIDFDAIWVPLALELIDMILEHDTPQTRLRNQKLLLQSIGIGWDHKMQPDSIYASGTMDEVADILFYTAIKQGIMLPSYSHFLDLVRDKTSSYIKTHKSSVKAIPGVETTLSSLKQSGFVLGVSTSDNEENTHICLTETRLIAYFDYIGCPDRSKQPKPAGDILLDFACRFGLQPEEIAVVGDTSVDIAFARQNRAGLAIGVLSGIQGGREFVSGADYVLPTAAELIRDNQPIWAHALRNQEQTDDIENARRYSHHRA